MGVKWAFLERVCSLQYESQVSKHDPRMSTATTRGQKAHWALTGLKFASLKRNEIIFYDRLKLFVIKLFYTNVTNFRFFRPCCTRYLLWKDLDFRVFVLVTRVYIKGSQYGNQRPIENCSRSGTLTPAPEILRPFQHFYARSATFVPADLKTVSLDPLFRFKKR